MPLTKLDIKLENIDRIVEYGKRDVLQLIDRETKEILATISQWNFKRLNPLQQDGATYQFKILELPTIVDILPTCGIAFNGRIHTVKVRDNPDAKAANMWMFKTLPTNEILE